MHHDFADNVPNWGKRISFCVGAALGAPDEELRTFVEGQHLWWQRWADGARVAEASTGRDNLDDDASNDTIQGCAAAVVRILRADERP